MGKWRTGDWIWLIGILLAIIVSVVTIRLNDNDSVVNIISLLSSASSITLAIVAIWQSSKNNSESNKTLGNVNVKLDFIDKNLITIQKYMMKGTKEAVKKSPIPVEEQEEFMEIIRKQEEDITINTILTSDNKYSDSIKGKCYINKFYSEDNKLNDELNKLNIILKKGCGNEVRYRIEGTNVFKNDILISYKMEKDNVEITLENDTIQNKKIKEVSFSEYEDRIDFWLYGDKTNRFNLNKNPN